MLRLKNNTLKPILFLGWVLFFICLWFKGCEKETKIVTIPEVKGKFEPTKEIIHTVIDTVYIERIKRENNEKLISDINTLLKENEALKQNYIDSDSLQRELMYLKAIKLNEFYHEFDNDAINILAKGIVQGEVKQMWLNYTIKERKIEVENPADKIHTFIGLGIGTNKNFDNSIINLNFGIQNKKGNIIRATYGTDKNLFISFDKRLF